MTAREIGDGAGHAHPTGAFRCLQDSATNLACPRTVRPLHRVLPPTPTPAPTPATPPPTGIGISISRAIGGISASRAVAPAPTGGRWLGAKA